MNNLTTPNRNGVGPQSRTAPDAAPSQTVERFVTPRATVVDSPEAVILELEMPGVGKDNVHIMVERDELTVTGSRRTEEYANTEVLYQERPTHHYRRAFVLSECIDGNKATAGYENGVLRLTLPKCEDSKPRKIEIQ